MRLAGLVKTSLIDYPGKIAAVVFTQGCNFRCGFCHNPELIPLAGSVLTEGEVLEFLESRKGRLEGVVVTGGEPTLQKDLPKFLTKIKKMGYSVKLDTNGSNPDLFSDLMAKKLIDYVAMDVKGGPSQYEKICGYNNLDAVKKSIKLIINSGIDYEFRTTTLPFYHKISDFEDIGKMIRGARSFTIQGFRSEITLDKDVNPDKFSLVDLEKAAKIMRKFVGEVTIRANL